MDRLTPAECMKEALSQNKIEVSEKQANEIKNIFLELMDENGYILRGTNS